MLGRFWIGAFCVSLLGACTAMGTVELRGQIESAHVRELRYFLDSTYGLSALDMALSRDELVRDVRYASLFPDPSGQFATGELTVVYDGLPSHPPPPVFWIAFSNERDVLYGVGPVNNGFDYATFDADTNTRLDRGSACWVVRSGTFTRPSNRSVILSLVIAPNPRVTKDCTDPPEAGSAS